MRLYQATGPTGWTVVGQSDYTWHAYNKTTTKNDDNPQAMMDYSNNNTATFDITSAAVQDPLHMVSSLSSLKCPASGRTLVLSTPFRVQVIQIREHTDKDNNDDET